MTCANKFASQLPIISTSALSWNSVSHSWAAGSPRFRGVSVEEYQLAKLKESHFANSMRVDWKELLEMVESGEVDPTIMVTHRIPIDDIDKGYKLQEKRAEGWVKCFVETRFSAKRAEGTPELVRL